MRWNRRRITFVCLAGLAVIALLVDRLALHVGAGRGPSAAEAPVHERIER